MTAVGVLTRRFLLDYGRNPVNLVVLILILMGGSREEVEIVMLWLVIGGAVGPSRPPP